MTHVELDNHELISEGESLSESFLEGAHYKFEENTSSTAYAFKNVFKKDTAYMENTITLLNSPKRAQNEKYLRKRVKSFPLITVSSLMPEEYENTDIATVDHRNGNHTPFELSSLVQSPSIVSLRGESKRNISNKVNRAEKELSPSLKVLKTSPYRRKSDCSYCHGGISLLELKIAHVAVDYLKRNEPDDLSWLTMRLVPSQRVRDKKTSQQKLSTHIIDKYSEGISNPFGKDSRTLRPTYSSKTDGVDHTSIKIQESTELGGWKKQKINNKATDFFLEQALESSKRNSLGDQSPTVLEAVDDNIVHDQPLVGDHNRVDFETFHSQQSVNIKSSPKLKLRTHHAHMLSHQIAKTNAKSEILMQKLQSIVAARHNLAVSTSKSSISPEIRLKKSAVDPEQNKLLTPKSAFLVRNNESMNKKTPFKPVDEILVAKSITSPNRLRIKQIYRKSNVPEIPQVGDHTKLKAETSPSRSNYSIRRQRTVENTVYTGLSFENRIILQPSSQRCTKTTSDQNVGGLRSKIVMQNFDDLKYSSQSAYIDPRSTDSPILSNKRSRYIGLKKQGTDESPKSSYSVYLAKPVRLRLPKLKEGLNTQSLYY